MAAEPCQLLSWDTAHFGVRVGRVRARRLDAGAMDRALAWAAAKDVMCLYLLADAEDSDTWRLAASRGFRFVDLRMTLSRSLNDIHQPRVSHKVALRPPRRDDEPALLDLARASHVDSRFYADGRFDPGAVEGLYERWMQRSLEGTLADVVIVGDADGEAVGYITGSLHPVQGIGSIELVGVSAQRRAAGIGGALVFAALDRFREAGLTAASVVTQGRNVGGQRLYQACGFQTELVQLWYHRWSDEHDRDGTID